MISEFALWCKLNLSLRSRRSPGEPISLSDLNSVSEVRQNVDLDPRIRQRMKRETALLVRHLGLASCYLVGCDHNSEHGEVWAREDSKCSSRYLSLDVSAWPWQLGPASLHGLKYMTILSDIPSASLDLLQRYEKVVAVDVSDWL